jgi:hypothetical protein
VLTSRITWDGPNFVNLDQEGIQDVNRALHQILQTVCEEVGMEKVQKHLETQAEKAVKQATRRMLKNKTSREIVAEEVAKSKQAREVVAKEMSDEELLTELTRRGPAR